MKSEKLSKNAPRIRAGRFARLAGGWRISGVLVATMLVVMPAGIHEAMAVTAGERFATDPNTGLALDGYDAVSYFFADRPRAGLSRYEWRWAGATWRFANEGNLAAFRRSPRAYAPQFGGHGALAVARGYAAVGNPLVFAIRDKRLYLFYSRVNRRGWILEPARQILAGKRHWRRMIADPLGF